MIGSSAKPKGVYILDQPGGTWSKFSPEPVFGPTGGGPQAIFAIDGWIFVHDIGNQRMAHYNPKTGAWEYHKYTSASITVYDIHGVAPDDVWMVGGGNRAWRWNGSSWTLHNVGSSDGYTGVWMFATDDVWIVGGSGGHESVHRFNGVTWSSNLHSQFPKTSKFVYDVWGFASDDVWFSGAPWVLDGHIYHYNGSIFTIQSSRSHQRKAIWGTDNKHIWTIGTDSTQSKSYCEFWDGLSWNYQHTGSPVNGSSVHGLNDQCIYHCGNRTNFTQGKLWETQDAGASWALSEGTFAWTDLWDWTMPSTLGADKLKISESTGGVVHFTIDAGSGNALRKYILLGCISGVTPGLTLPGGKVTMPINFDLFTSLVISLINTSVFQSFMGVLDAQGSADATMTFGPIPGAAGITMNFAYALNKPWNFASNPIAIMIIP